MSDSTQQRMRDCPDLAALRDRLLARSVVDENGCRVWQGPPCPKGYGRLTVQGRSVLVHRAAYEAFVGPIPDGLVIDHLCETKLCVNVEHMEPTTSGANLLRSPTTLASQNAAKTHCKRGHEFTPENTRVQIQRQGRYVARHCVECARDRDQERQKREAIHA